MMLSRTRVITGFASLAAIVALANMSSAADGLQCPKACPSTVNEPQAGQVPQGVSLFFMCVSAYDGTATQECATCTGCEAFVVLIWNGNGTNFCMQYANNGGSLSSPLHHYSRNGSIKALCAQDGVPGEADFYVQIINCYLSGQGPLYFKDIELLCGCT